MYWNKHARVLIIITGFTCLSLLLSAQNVFKDSLPQLITRLNQSVEDTNRITLLLAISEYYLHKAGEQPADINAAFESSNKALALSKKLQYTAGLGKSFIALSKVCREKADTKNGKQYSQKAIDILANSMCFLDIGNAWVEKAAYLDTWDQQERTLRIEYYEHGVAALKTSGDKLAYAKQLNFLAELIGINGNIILSLQDLHEALYVYQSINYNDLAGIYNLMGGEYSLLNNFTEALKYGLLAARISEEAHDVSPQMGTIYNRLGLTYFRTDDSEKALLYFQKSIAIAENYKDTNNIATVAHNLCDALIKLKKYEKAATFMEDILKTYPRMQSEDIVLTNSTLVTSFRSIQQYRRAKSYFDKIESIAKQFNKYHFALNSVYKVGIPLFFELHDYQKATKLNDEYAVYCSTDSSSLMMASTYLWRSKIDSARGDFRSAFINNQKYNEINNAIYNESKSNQLASIQVQFDTEKKEQDIINLTRQAKLQKATFEQERLVKNVIIGGTVLLLLILILLYNSYRIKQKTNKLLLSQQEEINQKNQSLQALINQLHKLINEKEWLVKEIHHRVKNNLQIVVSLLQTQAANLTEGKALQAISESQHRMQAISLLHQKLYHQDSEGFIAIDDYIKEMISYLKDSFTVDHVYFELDIDHLKLDVSQAVPVGLILNEAVTNAIKYAF